MKEIRVESEHHVEIDPYQMLGIGIIRQAADDYRRLQKKLHEVSDPAEIKSLEDEIESIRRFFRSNWFSTISGLESGLGILMKLDEEVLDID